VVTDPFEQYEQRVEFTLKVLPHALKRFYDELVSEGFSEASALTLTQAWLQREADLTGPAGTYDAGS
jgi:hypothetical protein